MVMVKEKGKQAVMIGGGNKCVIGVIFFSFLQECDVLCRAVVVCCAHACERVFVCSCAECPLHRCHLDTRFRFSLNVQSAIRLFLGEWHSQRYNTVLFHFFLCGCFFFLNPQEA